MTACSGETPGGVSGGFGGALWLGADASAYGYCVDPARPDLRCWVEIMAEDRLAATVLAREPSPELAASGCGDGAHGFRASLPPQIVGARSELLVWARVKGMRRGFAQRLLIRPGLAEPAPEREAEIARAIADLSEQLAALCRRRARPGAPAWRDAARGLAGRLGSGAGGCPGRDG